MDHATVLNRLYGDNLDEILMVLNASIYAKDYQPSKNSLIVHTGVVFSTHKNTAMTLLYDIASNTIIKQVFFESDSVLSINGVVYGKADTGFFRNYDILIILAIISVDDSDKSEFLRLDNSVYNENINQYPEQLTVISDNGNQKTEINNIRLVYKAHEEVLPFQKTIETPFYFDGSFFYNEY